MRAERDVLAEVHNPYVVKLYYSFQVCYLNSLPHRSSLAQELQAVFHICPVQAHRQSSMQQKLFVWLAGQTAVCLSHSSLSISVVLLVHAVVRVSQIFS